MNTKTISTRDARANFADLLGSVYYTQQPVIVEKKGKPVAVIVNPDIFKRMEEQAREKGWTTVDSLQTKNKDKDETQEYEYITAVVNEARKERYEKDRKEKRSY